MHAAMARWLIAAARLNAAAWKQIRPGAQVSTALDGSGSVACRAGRVPSSQPICDRTGTTACSTQHAVVRKSQRARLGSVPHCRRRNRSPLGRNQLGRTRHTDRPRAKGATSLRRVWLMFCACGHAFGDAVRACVRACVRAGSRRGEGTMSDCCARSVCPVALCPGP